MTTAKQRDQILQKAYQIWESEGRESGRDMEHWLRAELLISSAGKPRKAKKKVKSTPKKGRAPTKPRAKATPKAKTSAKPA